MYSRYLEKKINKKSKENAFENKIRIHNVAFKNKTIFIPNWLYDLPKLFKNNDRYRNEEFYIEIKRYSKNEGLKNVEYFGIQLAMPIFNGLSNIRIFSNQIIYFFNRGKYDKGWECVPILESPEDTDIEIESYLR